MKKLELFLKNIFFQLLIFFSSSNRFNAGVSEINAESKILLIRLNKIGDALVTTPLIKEIKSQTGARIEVLADTKNHFIFENTKYVDDVIIFKKGLGNFFHVLKYINKQKYDILVDLHDDVSTTVSFLVALAKTSVKFALRKSNEKIYSQTIDKLDPQKYHVIERVNEIGKLLGLKIDNSEINIQYSCNESSIENASAFINSKFDSEKFLVGINISAGSDARFWGVEKYRALVDYFQNMNVQVLILTAKHDIEKANAIAANEIPVYSSPSLDEFSAVISKMNFLVTPDTSIVHIASAFLIPVFGLYVKYQTTDKIWSPYKSDFECVITEEATLHNIGEDKVIKKLEPFFENKYYEYQNT